jgi:hypothetical protein
LKGRKTEERGSEEINMEVTEKTLKKQTAANENDG